MADETDLSAFEHRTRAALREGTDALPAATRSRLARARQAALAAAAPRRAWGWLPVPAGVGGAWFGAPAAVVPAGLAAAVVAAVLLLNGGLPATVDAQGAALADLELLADADAWALAQEDDREFVEWAAAVGNVGAELAP